jgi:agmatinase
MRQEIKDLLRRLAEGLPAESPDAGIFGCSVPADDSAIVLIPVPWEATVSYGKGTAQGPATILRASHQVDLLDEAFGTPFLSGITMLAEDMDIVAFNATARRAAEHVMNDDGPSPEDHEGIVPDQDFVNETSLSLHGKIFDLARKHLKAGKVVGVIGGEHSSPYGLLRALNERERGGFGVLHIDAHMDLRDAYEGFTHSHASIMRNVMNDFSQVTRLTQVAIRDFCQAERDYATSLGSRYAGFTSRDLGRRKAEGHTWQSICQQIVETLPKKVYVSFDIDGLEPSLCPGTGTPVPGGMRWDEAMYLLETVATSGRQVIGFDLCEVAPGPDGEEWNGNVGARVLYKLCGLALSTQGKTK